MEYGEEVINLLDGLFAKDRMPSVRIWYAVRSLFYMCKPLEEQG
jgi:hypothetical protein